MAHSHRASKERRTVRNFSRGATASALSFLALTACAPQLHESGKASTEPSAVASGNVPSTEITTITNTPAASPLSTENAVKIKAQVCDGFWSQTLSDGTVEVIGRPVVDSNGNPKDVETNRFGVEILPLQEQPGETQWYDIYGNAVAGIGDISCAAQTLYGRELTQPNGSNIWVATSRNNQPTPRTWDAAALDPAGFGGVGLDYGPTSMHDFGDTLDFAQRQHDRAVASASASPRP